MGCSTIGHPCDRVLWNEWTSVAHTDAHTAQTERIFERGLWEEERVELWLKAHNVPVLCKQTEVNSSYLRGHLDMVIGLEGKQTILEIKTTNDTMWKTILKKGVAACKPVWWTQMQCYLNLFGQSQSLRALRAAPIIGRFWIANRNTEAVYEEICQADQAVFAAAEAKAQRIQTNTEQPLGLACNLRAERECHFCPYRSACWPLVGSLARPTDGDSGSTDGRAEMARSGSGGPDQPGVRQLAERTEPAA